MTPLSNFLKGYKSKMPYSLNKNMSKRTINNESFIYDRETSEIHTLNKTGSIILDMLLQNSELPIITKTIHEQFEVDLSNAENDVNEFIKELVNKKVLLNSDQTK